MENRTNFDLRIAAHQREIARINAGDWQYQTKVGLLHRFRTTLASPRAPRTTQPALPPRPLAQTTVERPL